MASSFPAVVAAVCPDCTVPADPVVPVAVASWSTAPAPATVDIPAYSMASTPMSPVPDVRAVMAGVAPAPAVTGAVQTLTSVFSLACQCATSVNVSPAASVTPLATGPVFPQTPTSTTSRPPEPSADGRVTARLVPPTVCAPTCWTKTGVVTGAGVTTLDSGDGGEVPAALVALTVNV